MPDLIYCFQVATLPLPFLALDSIEGNICWICSFHTCSTSRRESTTRIGNIWVISGVGQDCENGMKFKMTVIEDENPTASPAPEPAPESSDWTGDSEQHWPTPAPSSGYGSKPW
ncbi:hypothetical protein SUGI_0873130 [Cryptomeria japonica]|nr:hypothetical protein SUGI_0873130 [Cryptomeria japonica]